MKNRILDIAKWTVIFLIGAVIFYAVYPKYTPVKGVMKFNKITGSLTVVKEIEEGLKRRQQATAGQASSPDPAGESLRKKERFRLDEVVPLEGILACLLVSGITFTAGVKHTSEVEIRRAYVIFAIGSWVAFGVVVSGWLWTLWR